MHRLIAMHSPADVRGSALLLTLRNGDPVERQLLLPALGRAFTYGPLNESVERVFGTDLSLADIEARWMASLGRSP